MSTPRACSGHQTPKIWSSVSKKWNQNLRLWSWVSMMRLRPKSSRNKLATVLKRTRTRGFWSKSMSLTKKFTINSRLCLWLFSKSQKWVMRKTNRNFLIWSTTCLIWWTPLPISNTPPPFRPNAKKIGKSRFKTLRTNWRRPRMRKMLRSREKNWRMKEIGWPKWHRSSSKNTRLSRREKRKLARKRA